MESWVSAPSRSSSTRPNKAKIVTLNSTLDGHATLPRRVIWQATPTIPTTQISEVDFLIDGRLAW